MTVGGICKFVKDEHVVILTKKKHDVLGHRKRKLPAVNRGNACGNNYRQLHNIATEFKTWYITITSPETVGQLISRTKLMNYKPHNHRKH